ncbi:MAG: hypothetical protein AAGA66_03840, partial [Bacteroidota bacterium]
MRIVEKRDYIHSHLHEVDEKILNEIYQVMASKLQNQADIVAYEANGTPITKLIAIAYMTLAERKVMAAIQRRKGPNV